MFVVGLLGIGVQSRELAAFHDHAVEPHVPVVMNRLVRTAVIMKSDTSE